MPSHAYHNIIRELMFGEKKKMNTDQILDYPFKFYGGKTHRKYFHNPRDIMLLSFLVKDKKKFLEEAMLHMWADKLRKEGKVIKIKRVKRKRGR